MQELTPVQRRDVLHACAAALSAAAERLVSVVTEETGLAPTRLRAELDRTTGQFRLLGDYAAQPWRRTSDNIITVPVPIGPVAVFAASNFPLAFGVSGGDTASALAAGCPVHVQAHPAQPRTGALLGSVLDSVLPAGSFHLRFGGPDASLELVRDPAIKAVAFTGSLRGGRALMDAAAARPDPIPVYAEMGSLNPVVVFPGYAGGVDALAASVTGSAGQLCTKPGLVLTPSAAFAADLAAAVAAASTHRMLTVGMAEAHEAWLARAASYGDVVAGAGSPAPFAVIVEASAVAGELLEEHFGPSVVIAVGSELPEFDGSLTATVLAGSSDMDSVRAVLPRLMSFAGRIIWNGMPTGVAVCDAMQHGGPWPASSASWSTSVGPRAVERFRRPVALQGFPAGLL